MHDVHLKCCDRCCARIPGSAMRRPKDSSADLRVEMPSGRSETLAAVFETFG